MIGTVQYVGSTSPVEEVLEENWADLDDRTNEQIVIEAITITRGRRDEFERTPTGTATISLHTRGDVGEFLDAQQIRIRLWNPVLETWTIIFRGYVQDVSWEIDPSELLARGEVSCVDLLDYLAGYELTPDAAGHPGSRPIESEGDIYYEPAAVDDRIFAALGDAGVPASLYEVFSGNVAVQQTVYPPRTSALEVLQDAAEAEWPGIANIYVSKSGVVTFHGRRARFFPDVAEYDIDEWNIGDSEELESNPDTTAQIRGLSFVRDRSMLINHALATPQNIDDADIEGQIVSDPTSITTKGLHSWSAENLLTAGHISDGEFTIETAKAETLKFSQYYVENYNMIRGRITSVVLKSLRPTDQRGPYNWRVLTEIEISDIVNVFTTHPGPGGGLSESFFVEGIRYEIRPLTPEYADVAMTLELSPQMYYAENPFDSDSEPS